MALRMCEVVEEFSVLVEANVAPLLPGTWHAPPEGGEYGNFKVSIWVSGKWIDVTEALHPDERERYREALRLQIEREGDVLGDE